MSFTITALGRIYQHSFDSHPHLTLACTNAALSSLGDLVAQASQIRLQKHDKNDTHNSYIEYDIHRTIRFLCFGLAMGPIIGRWNGFLEIRFPLRPSRLQQTISSTALGKRVLSDQLVMAPLGVSLFLGSMGIMEGRSYDQIAQKYTDLYKPALIANWKVWPLAQLINFRYMPLPYRVPFSQTCGVFWTLYLSLLNSKEDAIQDRQLQNKKTLDS